MAPRLKKASPIWAVTWYESKQPGALDGSISFSFFMSLPELYILECWSSVKNSSFVRSGGGEGAWLLSTYTALLRRSVQLPASRYCPGRGAQWAFTPPQGARWDFPALPPYPHAELTKDKAGFQDQSLASPATRGSFVLVLFFPGRFSTWKREERKA